MIPGDLLSAFPHRQFNTLPGLLDSWAALPNSNPNACMPMQGGSLYHFYDGLWYDPAERRTHDLPCERRTRYWLSQPDTVYTLLCIFLNVNEFQKRHKNHLVFSCWSTNSWETASNGGLWGRRIIKNSEMKQHYHDKSFNCVDSRIC